MDKKVKIGLIVGGVLALGGLAFFIMRKVKQKKGLKIKDYGTDSSGGTTTQQTTTETSVAEIAPFESKSQGNKFRNWVNDNRSSYATKNSLDRSGSHTNSYIIKAWKKFGAEYVADEEVAEELGGTAIADLTTAYNSVKASATANARAIATGAINILTGGSTTKVPSGAFNAETSAKAIKASMKGVGTDENLFFDTARRLTESERGLVKAYFNSKLGDGTKLCGWIEGEFSGSSEREALKLFGYPTGAFWSNCE